MYFPAKNSSPEKPVKPYTCSSTPLLHLVTEAPEATPIRIQLLPVHRSTLLKAYHSHPLLHRLPPDDFINALQCYEIDEQKGIYERGKPAEYFYILQEGSIRTESPGHICDVTEPGSCFGEQGIISQANRIESAASLTNACFWRMSADVYRNFLSRIRGQMSNLINSSVEMFSLFAELPQEQLPGLIQNFTPLKYTYGAKIVSQGEPGDCIYFLISGKVAVTESESWRRNLGPGDFFGEQSILYNCPRTASVTASTEEVICMSLSRKVLEGHLGNSVYQMIYKNTLKIALDRSQFLIGLREKEKNRLVDSMQVMTFEMGETVIKAGTWRGFGMWVVLSGSLRSGSDTYGVFQCIGDDQILTSPDGCFLHDVVADYHEVAVASIGRSEVEECLNISTDFPLTRIPVTAISLIRLFDGVPRSSIAKLCASVQLFSFYSNEVIQDVHRRSEFIYVLKSGAVKVLRGERVVRVATMHDHFGEMNLLPDTSKWVTVVSEQQSECWAIDRQTFQQEFPQALVASLYKHWEKEVQVASLRDLTPVVNLGSSLSSVTTLCISLQGHLYAMKSIARTKIAETNLQQDLLMERNVLLRLNHPFIPRFMRTYKDEECVYFLTEFVNGVSLFEVINERRVLPECDAQFYAGSILLVLEYLHSRKIVHRDLKPEHVLIDSDGYIKLVDFSTAKVCERTNSVIGTPQFMAPEVILGKTYSHSSDLWSLGIVLFELLTGGPPFALPEEDPFTICTQILTEKLVIPNMVSPSSAASDLIKQLLSRTPYERGSAEELKFHPFFSYLSFVPIRQESIIEKTERPPYIPTKTDYSRLISEARKATRGWKEVVEVTITQGEAYSSSVEMPFRTVKDSIRGDWDSVF